jgi:polysaccharide pyruvyl transferase WcaK-like protein/nitrate reductase gamma subunit
MKIRSGVGDALDIGLLSAGSAAVLLIGSHQLTAPAFANLGMVMAGQVVINILVRAAYAEPLLVIRDPFVARRLLRNGLRNVAVTTVLLALATIAMLPVPLPFLLMVVGWSVAWFLLDFRRCMDVAMPARRGAVRLAVPAVLLAAFALAVIAQWRGHPEWSFLLWAGAYVVTLAMGARLATTPLIAPAATRRHGQALGDSGYHSGRENDSGRGHADPHGSDLDHGNAEVTWPTTTSRSTLYAVQRRFLLDALALQVAVQLAIFLVGLIGPRDVAAAFRLSQILYFPASMATLAVQTRTVGQLSGMSPGTAWRQAVRSTLRSWTLPSTLAVLPAVALLSGPAKWMSLNLPPTYGPMLSVLPVIVATKCADVMQNYGVAFLRGVGAYRASSFQRRLWGGCAAAAIVGTAPFNSVSVTFMAAMVVAVACAGLAAVAIVRGILSRRAIRREARQAVTPSDTVVCGNLLGKNFGDDLMLAGLLLHEPDVSAALVQRLAPAPNLLGRQLAQIPWTVGNTIQRLRSASRLVVAGGTHLAFRRQEPAIGQLRVLVSWAVFAWIARWLNTEVHMRAVGIGPLESRLARLLTRFTLLAATQVSVRDAGSESLCRTMGIGTSREPDLAYRYLRASRSTTSSSDGGELPVLRYLVVAPASSGFDLDYWVHRTLDLARKTNSERIVVAASEVHGSRSDVAVCDQIAEQLRSISSVLVTRVDYSGELEAILALLAGAEIVLAARYHVVLAAQELARTVVPIEYHPKVTQLLLESGPAGQPPADVEQSIP